MKYNRRANVVSGRAELGDLLRAFAKTQAGTGDGGGPLCGTPNFFNAVKTMFLSPGADIMSAPSKDFTQATCNALSLATSFAAVPASFGKLRALGPTPCGDNTEDPQFKTLWECP